MLKSLNGKAWPRISRYMVVIGILAGVSLMAPLSAAGPHGTPQSQDKANQQHDRQFSAKIGAAVLAAQTELQAENYRAALEMLKQAERMTGVTPYEKSVILQMKGAVFYELGDNQNAIAAFTSAISAGGLTAAEVRALQLNISQLLIATAQFEKGAKMLTNWVTGEEDIDQDNLQLLWHAWMQAERYDKALPWAKLWFDRAAPPLRKHFDALNFLYNQLDMEAEQAGLVKRMIEQWPHDKSLWQSWRSLLAASGQEEAAFTASVVMYENGLLAEQAEILQLVQYYSYYNIPYQGAGILERELNAGRISKSAAHFTLLADLYRQAREYKKAIPVLAHVATLDESPRNLASLGEAYYNQNDCTAAETALKGAIAHGYPAGKAWSLIGACRYDASALMPRPECDDPVAVQETSEKDVNWQAAIDAYKSVPEHTAQARSAQVWIDFIRNKRNAIQEKCAFIEEERAAMCMLDWQQAYENKFLNDGLILQDPNCKAYQSRFVGLTGSESAGD